MKTTHMLRKQVKKGNVGSLGKHTGIQLSTVIWGIRKESAYSKLFQEEKKPIIWPINMLFFKSLTRYFVNCTLKVFFFYNPHFIIYACLNGEGKENFTPLSLFYDLKTYSFVLVGCPEFDHPHVLFYL